MSPWVRPMAIGISQWNSKKMATRSQTTFTLSSKKRFVFGFQFHWIFFLGVQLAAGQHWFMRWLGADQALSHEPAMTECSDACMQCRYVTRAPWRLKAPETRLLLKSLSRLMLIIRMFLWMKKSSIYYNQNGRQELGKSNGIWRAKFYWTSLEDVLWDDTHHCKKLLRWIISFRCTKSWCIQCHISLTRSPHSIVVIILKLRKYLRNVAGWWVMKQVKLE